MFSSKNILLIVTIETHKSEKPVLISEGKGGEGKKFCHILMWENFEKENSETFQERRFDNTEILYLESVKELRTTANEKCETNTNYNRVINWLWLKESNEVTFGEEFYFSPRSINGGI